jgi:hypothetical protein
MMNYMNGMMNYIDRKVRKRFLRLFFLSAPLLLLATACSQEEALEESSATPVTLQISAAIEGETRAAEKTAFEEGDVISVYLSSDTSEKTPYQYVLEEDGSWVATGDNLLTLTTEEVEVYAKYRGEETTLQTYDNVTYEDYSYTSAEELKSEILSVSLTSPKANFKFKPTQFMVKFNLITFGGDLTGKSYTLGLGKFLAKGELKDSTITLFFEEGDDSFDLSFYLNIEGIDEDLKSLQYVNSPKAGHSYVYDVYIPAFLDKSEVQVGDVRLSNNKFIRPYTNGVLDTNKAAVIMEYLTQKNISTIGVVYYASDSFAYMIALQDHTSDSGATRFTYEDAKYETLSNPIDQTYLYLFDFIFGSDYKENTISPILELYGGKKLEGDYWGYIEPSSDMLSFYIYFVYPGGSYEIDFNDTTTHQVRFIYNFDK